MNTSTSFKSHPTLFLVIFLLFLSCKDTKEKKEVTADTPDETMIEKNEYSFYVGTYTNGDSKGIYQYAMKADGSLEKIGLSATTENPSFLSFSNDKKFLLAANEVHDRKDGMGGVTSYAVKGDSLSFINSSLSGGADPCFIKTNKNGYVLTANYTGGNIGLLQLDNEGKLSPLLDVQQHKGRGTTDRQEAPHAHTTWFVPGTTNEVISIDLGTNELWLSTLDEQEKKLIPSKPNTVKLTPGAGPRHLAFHPNNSSWIYVINELNATISLLKKNDTGGYDETAIVHTLPDGYDKPNSCADIHISSDAKFLYATNRGHNSIAIYAINQADGTLTLLGHESTFGNWPRNFALSPDENYLLVANQLSNNLVSYKRNTETGMLQKVSEIEAPAPVYVLFR